MTRSIQVVSLTSISLIIVMHGRLSLSQQIKLGKLCTILHGYEIELDITLGISMYGHCMQAYFIVGIPVKCSVVNLICLHKFLS